MRTTLLIFALLLVALLLYLLAWPLKFDPLAWTPESNPGLAGDFSPNSKLADLELISIGTSHGPEDVAVDPQGRIYTGTVEGQILRFQTDGTGMEVLAETAGRPLGLDFDKEGNLIIADADKGLLRLSPQGKLETLTTSHNDRPFLFTDDIEVGSDGKYYFSDASSRWDIQHVIQDLLEGRPYGRLLVYDPGSGKTDLLLDSLYFANGVALNDSADFVLVNETARFQIRKHWIKGPKKGQTEMLIENLPGFPDGISRGSDGIFWLAFPTPRQESLDKLMGNIFMKKVIMRLPAAMHPEAERYGFALGLDAEGNVRYNLQDPEGKFSQITSVQQSGNSLYFGSLVEPVLGRLPLEKIQ